MEIPKKWRLFIGDDLCEQILSDILPLVSSEYASNRCFPPKERIFYALEKTLPENIKVVIVGQDPYHGAGQANGLAFSVSSGNKIPPSLLNIFKEIQNEFLFSIPKSGDLTSWAEQGVLLLNNTLTVREGMPNSHAFINWYRFTDLLIQSISQKKNNVVFVLWGNLAGQKAALIDQTKHLVLQSQHPSPLSAYRGFFGNNHFKTINDYLLAHQSEPINWNLSNQLDITFD